MSENKTQAFLAANPRMIGVLFAICMVLMQAGNVLAASANTTNGP